VLSRAITLYTYSEKLEEVRIRKKARKTGGLPKE
jgi:hypothetical protein